MIAVGLPFANIKSLELQLKLNYVKAHLKNTSNNSNIVEEYYENMCMVLVNQSIGRVIRHRDDYAALALLDERYNRPRTKKSLPSWIRSAGVSDISTFGDSMSLLAKVV